MKKFFLIVAFLAAAAISSYAQDIRISAGWANSKFADSGVPYDGFFVGLTAEKAFSGAIRFSSGLIYSSVSGNKPDASAVSIKIKEQYFSVPIHAVARIGITRDVFIVLEAGPSLSVGIASDAVPAGGSASYSLYGDDSNYGRFDIMAGGQVGIEYWKLRVFGGCNYGLFDRDLREAVELHRTEIVAGVAFKF